MVLKLKIESERAQSWQTEDLYDESNRRADITRLFEAANAYYQGNEETYDAIRNEVKDLDEWRIGLENLIKQSYHIVRREADDTPTLHAINDVAFQLLVVYISDYFKNENAQYNHFIDNKHTFIGAGLLLEQDETVRFDGVMKEEDLEAVEEELTRYERLISAQLLAQHQIVYQLIKSVLFKYKLAHQQ
ncbi:hypothetical protein [Thalassobacillus devorans]|uniref:hypothetical protein n=1 Tax=Thalassobacillus devorans TaxID=279813 RepID=UPI00048E75A4|nr:hypothetical protein [Thalassobacillus devorans]